MPSFEDKQLPAAPDVVAPDGSRVRLLGRLEGGSMAHFELGPGEVSRAVVHRTVEEIWYVVTGVGRMWRRGPGGDEREVELGPGLALTIPVGTSFQFRSTGRIPLTAVAVTMPPWPGDDEAAWAQGPWPPTV